MKKIILLLIVLQLWIFPGYGQNLEYQYGIPDTSIDLADSVFFLDNEVFFIYRDGNLTKVNIVNKSIVENLSFNTVLATGQMPHLYRDLHFVDRKNELLYIYNQPVNDYDNQYLPHSITKRKSEIRNFDSLSLPMSISETSEITKWHASVLKNQSDLTNSVAIVRDYPNSKYPQRFLYTIFPENVSTIKSLFSWSDTFFFDGDLFVSSDKTGRVTFLPLKEGGNPTDLQDILFLDYQVQLKGNYRISLNQRNTEPVRRAWGNFYFLGDDSPMKTFLLQPSTKYSDIVFNASERNPPIPTEIFPETFEIREPGQKVYLGLPRTNQNEYKKALEWLSATPEERPKFLVGRGHLKFTYFNYRAESYPRRLMVFNRETHSLRDTGIPLYALYSDYTFDVSPRGNLLVVPVTDTSTGLFKEWSIFRIVLDGVVIHSGTQFSENPIINSRVLGYPSVGSRIKILDRTDQKALIDGEKNYWYRVRISSGTEGWIFGSEISIQEE